MVLVAPYFTNKSLFCVYIPLSKSAQLCLVSKHEQRTKYVSRVGIFFNVNPELE